MFNVECSIEHRELRIEHSLETRDTIYEERALERFRNGPSRIVRVKAVQMRLPAEGNIDGELSSCGTVLVDDVGGPFL
jgi:hypothetical protein